MHKPGELVPYESDALTAFRARPLAVVLPESHEEVVQAVRWCARHRIPYVARGSGTSLSGGSLPIDGGLLIGLNRMNKLLRLDRRNASRWWSRALSTCRSRTLPPPTAFTMPPTLLPAGLDHWREPGFNSGGAHCLKYGMTSNHVLGAKVVLPDGETVVLGSESLENTGPDWLGLFVGSEGLLGIATEITLRLLPKPETYHTVLAAYDALEKAGEAVAAVVASGLLPGAMEIMDSLAIEAAEAAVRAGYPRRPGPC